MVASDVANIRIAMPNLIHANDSTEMYSGNKTLVNAPTVAASSKSFHAGKEFKRIARVTATNIDEWTGGGARAITSLILFSLVEDGADEFMVELFAVKDPLLLFTFLW
jgi:hypothetical protein